MAKLLEIAARRGTLVRYEDPTAQSHMTGVEVLGEDFPGFDLGNADRRLALARNIVDDLGKLVTAYRWIDPDSVQKVSSHGNLTYMSGLWLPVEHHSKRIEPTSGIIDIVMDSDEREELFARQLEKLEKRFATIVFTSEYEGHRKGSAVQGFVRKVTEEDGERYVLIYPGLFEAEHVNLVLALMASIQQVSDRLTIYIGDPSQEKPQLVADDYNDDLTAREMAAYEVFLHRAEYEHGVPEMGGSRSSSRHFTPEEAPNLARRRELIRSTKGVDLRILNSPLLGRQHLDGRRFTPREAFLESLVEDA